MKESQGLFKIIKRSFLWLFVTILLAGGSLILFFINFRPSIEFTWGIQLSLENVQNKDSLAEDVKASLAEKWFNDAQIHLEEQKNTTSLLVSLPFKDDNQVKEVSVALNKILIEDKYISSKESIIGSSLNGPSVSSYMRSSAINAIWAGLVLIAIYMMFSFMSMRKHISPLTLAIVTIATTVFDLSVPAGAYAIWMAINNSITVDTTFIIAILTIMWYSMNDTIIILDRIRENTIKHKEWLEKGTILYGNLIENSVWQTMRRSISTSMTVFIVVVAMYIFWQSVMKNFAFTMGFWVIAGSFSSIFLASPLVYILLNKWKKELPKL